MENTKECVRPFVRDQFIKNMGLDLTNKVENLTDIELLSVHNYCLSEYYECGGEVFTSLNSLVYVYPPSNALDFARSIYEGSGDKCFNPDNWVFVESSEHVEALTPDNRREFLMYKLANFNPEYIEVAIKELVLLDSD